MAIMQRWCNVKRQRRKIVEMQRRKATSNGCFILHHLATILRRRKATKKRRRGNVAVLTGITFGWLNSWKQKVKYETVPKIKERQTCFPKNS